MSHRNRDCNLVAVTVIFLAVVALSSCASQTGRAGADDDRVQDPITHGPLLDPGIWTAPLGREAELLTDTSAEELAYSPVEPTSLSGSTGAFIESRAQFGPLASSAWAFKSDSHGVFILVETPSGATQGQIEAPGLRQAGCSEVDPSADEPQATVVACAGEGFSVVPLATTNARGVEAAQAVSITWIVPAPDPSNELKDMFKVPVLEMTLMGPAEETTLDELVGIAKELGY